uniref:Uncharacterized protein n=1 Tax=Timema genevievae TaxID=629358 RepID=A0A7R9PM20_TIMGE|nr:unnamed protein product [Timema genevievae]
MNDEDQCCVSRKERVIHLSASRVTRTGAVEPRHQGCTPLLHNAAEFSRSLDTLQFVFVWSIFPLNKIHLATLARRGGIGMVYLEYIKVYPHFVEGKWKTYGSLVYCENSALDHAGTEAGLNDLSSPTDAGRLFGVTRLRADSMELRAIENDCTLKGVLNEILTL